MLVSAYAIRAGRPSAFLARGVIIFPPEKDPGTGGSIERSDVWLTTGLSNLVCSLALWPDLVRWRGVRILLVKRCGEVWEAEILAPYYQRPKDFSRAMLYCP